MNEGKAIGARSSTVDKTEELLALINNNIQTLNTTNELLFIIFNQEVFMNKEKVACVRNSLVDKMKELLASADNTIQKLKITDDKFADPCDRAAVEASKDIELNCRSKEWHLLLDIKETILRIDHGLYGMCDHCGRPISQKRLRAAPMSKLCVECQQKIETAHKKSRHRHSSASRISYNHA